MGERAERGAELRATVLLARRDLVAAVASLWSYGVAAAFCSISGLVFVAALVDGREASMRLFADPFDLLTVVVTSIVSARALSEERRAGTAELLFTLPLRSWQIVLGKYLSSVALLGGVLATTAALPVSLAILGRPDWGPLATQYLGALLLVVAFSAVGLAVSFLSANQAVVTVVGVAVALVLWSLGSLASSLTSAVRGPLLGLAPGPHVDALNRGLVDLADVAFFVAFAVAWLAAAAQLARIEALRR